MNLIRTIESAEKKFKQKLEEFFLSVYNEKSLSSHGIDHHRRVWNYSKDLIKLIHFNNTIQISKLASELIIACYLHDVGMSVDQGIKHGKHSRNLCIKFLAENNLPEDNYKDVLDAIENHDNKDYTIGISGSDLLSILSVSDDLDAFGFTGIYRYSDIYLAREIDPANIGYLIRKNAEKRFDNFIKTFGSVNEIIQQHSGRYKILDDFFIKYNEQLPYYHFGTNNPSGCCGVIETFVYMINNKIGLEEIYLNSDRYMVDSTIRWFFTELESELLVEHTVL